MFDSVVLAPRERRRSRLLSKLPRGFTQLSVSGTLLALLLLTFILAPWLAPEDPLSQNVLARLQGPSSAHWLGTDALGRDVLSRVMLGGTSALEGVLIALGTMTAIGIPWGLAAGYLGGIWDEALMRVADAFLALPALVLAIGITGVVGPSLPSSMVAFGVVLAPTIARLLRSSVLPLRRSEFVLISRSLGCGGFRAAVRHVLPNGMAPVLVQLCSFAAITLIAQAGLAFLGLGVQPPKASWGGDLANAYQLFESEPLLTVAPGLAITLTALLLNIVGDGIRQRLRTE